MHIKSLTKVALHEYIHSKAYLEADHIPISYHRAVSHINNPRANNKDVLLLMAIEDEELIGYLGILPDLLFVPHQPIIKIGWMSGMWVAEKARGRKISQQLIAEAHFKWNGNLISGDYVPKTKVIYEKTGFFTDVPLIKSGIRLYLKSDLQTLLPPKYPILQQWIPMLKKIDIVINRLTFSGRNKKTFKNNNYSIHEVMEVDREAGNLISSKNNREYFQRTKAELNWMLQYPWIKSESLTHSNDKYFFTSTSKFFENKVIQLKDSNNQLMAFFIFSNRNGAIKLPYFYSNCSSEICVEVIYHLLKLWNAKTFTTFYPALVERFEATKTVGLYKKKINRSYLVDKQLSKLITHINLFAQDGDGDIGFT